MFSKTSWKRIVLPTLLTSALLLPSSIAFAQTITVQSGDTLGKLASKYNVTIEHLKISNHLTSDVLFVGSTLYIPPKSAIYTVQSGDTLWKVATRFQTTIAKIQEINQMTRDSLLVGEKILIPETTSAPSTTVGSSTPEVPAGGTLYTVVSGDVLWKVADRFKVSIQSIVDANKLTAFELTIGQKLVIPAPTAQPTTTTTTTTATTPTTGQTNTYTVVSGDVLWKIADRFKVSIQAIVDANKLTSYSLNIGQVLIIPQSGTSPSPTAPTASEPSATAPATTAPEQPEAPATVQPEENAVTTPEAPPADAETAVEQPAPEPEPVTQPEQDSDKPWVEMIDYKVQQGDTGWSISIDHGIPMTEFLQVNNLGSNAYLSIGQIVKIPVHHVPELDTPSSKYGEYLDWFTGAQYVFPINAEATVTDFKTGKQFKVKRTIGAFHSDTEPLTAADSAIIKEIWGGNYSWAVRPVIVEVDGRRLAASMASMPHDIDYIKDNNFDGHFDIHFLNSLRHKDSQIDPSHQAAIKVAAGIQ
ncbi:LysM peptidoglycan-binding domain-containing protein [Brevibacillus migulae]|uniref:LysM peptidoglycan-binding domain-containing protein n=1 Tax=Brevibacillus migulae TaxID=1644114 RepID=UPI00106E9D5D|nr:LysM peptidoglycan-binding domain-containing protein [Brevibacillus migulae]